MNILPALISIILFIIPYVIIYFVIKAAVNRSNITAEIYSLRQDLSELEHRQSERFKTLDAHFQEQNQLLREQNEMMLRAERDRSQ